MGEQLQKAPLGYPKDHPMINFLRYKQWFIGEEWEDSACLTAKFADRVASTFAEGMPYLRWLIKASRAS